MRANKIVLLVIALASVIFGFAIGAYELWHAQRGAHALSAWPFFAAGMFILMGALVVQWGDVSKALETVTAAVPLLNTLRPGGKRATDPPADAVPKVPQAPSGTSGTTPTPAPAPQPPVVPADGGEEG